MGKPAYNFQTQNCREHRGRHVRKVKEVKLLDDYRDIHGLKTFTVNLRYLMVAQL
jgi:hypothetical protein